MDSISIMPTISLDSIGLYPKTTPDSIRHKRLYWDSVRMQPIVQLKPGSHGVVNWSRILLVGELVVITTWCELVVVVVGVVNDQK